MNEIREKSEAAVREAAKVIIGKEAQIRLLLAAVYAGGHILLDDLPGAGKTTLVKVLSRVLGCAYGRVQFTPDLLPSDVTGMSVFDQKLGDFRVKDGPIMTHLFLADEINRAIPRTQSALLEAMEEGQVTIDGEARVLPRPFFVMATQNPVETESTFRLPAAQMDRFLVRLSLGYPTAGEEVVMLRTVGDGTELEGLDAVLDAEAITGIQRSLDAVRITDAVLGYLVALVHATRESPDLALPASPRASRALYRLGKASAAMDGRDYVTPDDVKSMAPYVLAHRVALTGEARLAGQTPESFVADLLARVPVPGGEEDVLGLAPDAS
ncbi:MAG: MoxR family ATPase [Clostridiales Family XIII bacterium]|jgi:MoxR-like ATPase|nr:MoxR family ATPase [Clostridiales Family XIII bacterium]